MNWVGFISSIVTILLIVYLAYFEYFRSKLGVSTSHSSRSMRQALIAKAQELLPRSQPIKIIDPGCGTGDMVIALAQAFPDAKVIGLELSPVVYHFATLKKWLSGCQNLSIIKQDFFTFDYHDCDCVVVFLPIPVLHPLARHLEQHLPEHAVILSNAFQMPNHWLLREKILIQKILNRYLYVYNPPRVISL